MITSYKELTVNKYLQIKELEFNEEDALAYQCRLLAILDDKTEDEILALPLSEYHKLVSGSAFLLEKPKINGKVPKKIIFGGVKYTVCTDIPKLNVAQYVDYQNMLSMDNDKYIPNIIACFLVPEGHKYGDGSYDIDEVAKTVGEVMSIQEATNLCFFFFRKYRRLIEDTLIYLAWTIKRLKRKARTETTKEKLRMAESQMRMLTSLAENGIG